MTPTLTLLAVLFLGLAGCDQQQDLGHSSTESCRPGLTRCGSSCVDPLSDPNHCGSCGLTCPMDKLCQSGACVNSCSPPNSACSGGCVILYQDDRHCGGCTNVCPDAQHCDNGVCATCTAEAQFCFIPSRQSWRCANLATDSLHCGDCATSCPSGQQCTSGTCH